MAVLVLVLTAAVAVALASNGTGSPTTAAAGTTAGAAPPKPLVPTHLLAMPREAISNGTDAVTVALSGPAAQGSPAPTLRPAVAGTWADVGDDLVFTPASTLEPCATYRITVWANTRAADAAALGHRHVAELHVACPPVAGLQEALARLGYLPARLHTRYAVAIPSGREARREAAAHAFDPPRGALAPAPSDAPHVQLGSIEAVTRGALTVYQLDHGLEADGEPGTQTWNSIISAVSANRRSRTPYTWVTVSESLPETLQVHRGSRVVFSTPANTGVPGAETAQGVFPIYSRFVTTSMKGTDVDGTKYDVPDVPWVNYFNGGDAVHGYPRASYGFPQSNGCVELPIEAAHTVFNMLSLGDIVIVS